MMEFVTFDALFLALGAIGFGMVLLIKGGNWTVDGAIYIARRYGVSPLLVGFTIVAFGTSLPELIVSLSASFHDLPGIAVGNVIGSNIANILLVIGATAIFATLAVTSVAIKRDLIAMMLATCFLIAVLQFEVIGRVTGLLMLLALAAYAFWQYKMAAKGEIEVEDIEEPEYKSLKQAIIFLIIGLVSISIGAEFLVRGAKVSATIMGVPEDVIALSLIALGTSLPELTTCVIAGMRKQTDIVLGNIIGSNVFNIMMIIGATAAVKPIVIDQVAPQLVSFDVWVTLAVSALFTSALLFYGKINKQIGILFVTGYVGYISALYFLYMA